MRSRHSIKVANPGLNRQIELRGVRVHNLQQIDLDIPLGQFVVLSGVSGSGKSSLAFDTIFAEGQRRYIESFSSSARQYLERIERPNADRIAYVPPAVAIRTDAASRSSLNRMTVGSLTEIDSGLRQLFARAGRIICPRCQGEVRSMSPADIARAAMKLMEKCRFQICFAPPDEESFEPSTWIARGFTRVIVNGHSLALSEATAGAIPAPWIVVDRLVIGKASTERIVESAEIALREGNGRCLLLAETNERPVQSALEPIIAIDEQFWRVHRFSRHWDCPKCERQFFPLEPRLFEAGFSGGCLACQAPVSQESRSVCEICRGTQLCSEALAVRIGSHNFADIVSFTVDQAVAVLDTLANGLSEHERNASRLLRQEIHRRMQSVVDMGMGHLHLLRAAGSLSGGQIRRLMLSAAIGSRITGTLCVIDEPAAGLHPTEIPRVLEAIRQLLDLRNSVIVVDHSPQLIRSADFVIDLGPGAGPNGGTVVFTGLPGQLALKTDLATGRALSPVLETASTSRSVRAPTEWLSVEGVCARNLSGLDIRIPLGVLCVITGRGGCGKTTLLMEVLVPALRDRLTGMADSQALKRLRELLGGESLAEVAVIDRSPLTRSSRSNAAIWIEAFDEIRGIFGATPEAKLRGFGIQHFSFNAAHGGRCHGCHGTGVLRHDMQFLPDVTLTCPECGGTRFRREILDVKYRGKSIAEVLAMSAAEAAIFFRNHPRLQARMHLLKQIGLDYLVLGQPTVSLSGGEAQRLKLAARLTASRGPNLIACDEPTAGLHPADIVQLARCFDELLGVGHSIVVIDNSPALIRSADYVIDLDAITGKP